MAPRASLRKVGSGRSRPRLRQARRASCRRRVRANLSRPTHADKARLVRSRRETGAAMMLLRTIVILLALYSSAVAEEPCSRFSDSSDSNGNVVCLDSRPHIASGICVPPPGCSSCLSYVSSGPVGGPNKEIFTCSNCSGTLCVTKDHFVGTEDSLGHCKAFGGEGPVTTGNVYGCQPNEERVLRSDFSIGCAKDVHPQTWH